MRVQGMERYDALGIKPRLCSRGQLCRCSCCFPTRSGNDSVAPDLPSQVRSLPAFLEPEMESAPQRVDVTRRGAPGAMGRRRALRPLRRMPSCSSRRVPRPLRQSLPTNVRASPRSRPAELGVSVHLATSHCTITLVRRRVRGQTARHRGRFGSPARNVWPGRDKCPQDKRASRWPGRSARRPSAEPPWRGCRSSR